MLSYGIPSIAAFAFNFAKNVAVVSIQGYKYSDVLIGGLKGDLLDGGAGGDLINGGAGRDTVSYEHSNTKVSVNLETGLCKGGDAAGDRLVSIENIVGSANNDHLIGDAKANTLVSNGGYDTLEGGAGNDHIVISSKIDRIDGGSGQDTLTITEGSFVALTSGRFTGVEKINVENDATLNLKNVEIGVSIKSLSTADHGIAHDVDITGTSGADRITAGSGGDYLDGHKGNDKLFGGAGADIFNFDDDFGRDEIYKFNIKTDNLLVYKFAKSMDDINIKSVHGGADTEITFSGSVDPNQKIILHGVDASAVSEDAFWFV